MDTEITLERSEILTRNLIRSAIATLCWLRQVFPDICFEDKVMAGMTVKKFRSLEAFSLSPDHPLQLSNRVREWIEEGVFDALRKRYLDTIVFGVSSLTLSSTTDQDRNTPLIETYTIKIDYNDTSFNNSFQCPTTPFDNTDELFLSSQNPSYSTLSSQSQSQSQSQSSVNPYLCTIPCVRVASYETVKVATIQMLRSVSVFAQTMKPIPRRQCCCVSIRMLYKEGVTPLNYQPKHFIPLVIKNEENFGNFCSFDASECEDCPMGVVETDYHSVRVSIETQKQRKLCVNSLSPSSQQHQLKFKQKRLRYTNTNEDIEEKEEEIEEEEEEEEKGKKRKVEREGKIDEEMIAGREAAILLDKRDRVLFAMDIMEDLPVKNEHGHKRRRITREEVRDIMGTSTLETAELLFLLTELGSLRGSYSKKRNVFDLNSTKNTHWTNNPEEITLPVLKELVIKFNESLLNDNNGGNEARVNAGKRNARGIENPIPKTKGRFI